jgi:hypothetical protein
MTVRTKRTAWWLAAALVVACASLLAAASAAGDPGDALPDLVSDAPSGEYAQTYADPDGTSRLLLRFNGYVHNDGTGAFEMRGTGNTGGVMSSVLQRVYGADGQTWRDVPSSGSIQFETGDGHLHFHLRAAMQYALFDPTKATIVAPAMKVGFCLLDSQRVSGSADGTYAQGTFCERNNPGAASVAMGISPGWRDVYGSTLAFQWVDVSNLRPGSYWLAARSDPEGAILEASEANNGWAFKSTASLVPGWVAQPVSVSAAASSVTPVQLSALEYGAPGPVRYEIVTLPRNGTLDQQVGVPFDAPTVRYTPRAGFSGADTFVVAARDSTSEFPRTPARATVTVTVAGPSPSVSISGAPASLVVATGAQLTATVTGDAPDVTWGVDGVPGGNATVGTITPGGLYTAPAAVPPGGRVTIRASSARAAAEVAIAIEPAAPPQPAPAPATPPAPPAPQPAPASDPAAVPVPVTPPAITSPPASNGGDVAATVRIPALNPLSVPVLSARGRRLLVGLTSARAGTLDIAVLRAGKRLGGCSVRTPARRSVTCAVALARGTRLQGLAVRVRLRVNGKLLARRTAHVSRVAVTSVDGLRRLYCTLR